MGTRSLTILKNEQDVEICVIYKQFDGYESALGMELKSFLQNKEMVNGIPSGKDRSRLFNGMGDLAIRLISYLKENNGGINEAGGLYLYPPNTRDCGEEYIYEISIKDKKIHINTETYSGPVDDYQLKSEE